MKYAKFSDDFLSYFRLDDNGETLVLTDKQGCTRAVKLLPYEERPQGEWKSLGFVHSRGYAWCTCSNCGKTTKIYLDKDNDFCCIADIRNKAVACLFCGADMRKGGAE